MAHRTQLNRADAAAYAREQGWAGFRTTKTPEGMWKARYEPGENLGQAFAEAHPDLCSHGESSWHQGATGSDDADKVGVLVLTCGLDELRNHGEVGLDRAVAQAWFHPTDRTWGRTFLVEPHNADRWDVFTPKVAQASAPAEPRANHERGFGNGRDHPAPRQAAAPRERSLVESPVKQVHAICESMPGATRKEIVDACVAAGINKSTAGTQFYHWSKAKKDG